MENGSKINLSTDGKFQPLVSDDESQVREVVQAVATCDDSICVRDLPHEVRDYVEPANEEWVTLSEIEGRYVARVLEHTGGNKQAAARVLAVDRKTLDRMIKRHQIDCRHLKAHRARISSQPQRGT